MPVLTRRNVLIGTAAVAGGVAIGYWQLTKPYPNPLKRVVTRDEAALTPYVIVASDGVSIIAPRAEMGQNVRTTLAALVAEELDIGLEDVTVIHGPPSKAYFAQAAFEENVPFTAYDRGADAERMRAIMRFAGKVLAMQMTGGSSSVPDGFDRMRRAGAAARIVLMKAAAKKLKVNAATLKTENGAVVAADGTRIPYKDLAMLARDIEPPDDPPLKARRDWKLLGRSLPRVDMVEKCTGTAQYATDVRLPGMLYAAVRMNPHLGAPLNGFDAARAEAMQGVVKVLRIDNGVAVVARNTWVAERALHAIDFDWGAPEYAAASSEISASLAAAFDSAKHDSRLLDDGDVETALAEGEVIEAEYSAPYLAHATMETPGATALFKDGALEMWASSQIPTQAVKDAAKSAGVAESKVTLHTLYLGGGFGRRLEMDFIKQTAKIARAMEGTPIRLVWSREEDITHDAYRPAAVARMKASVKDGAVHAFDLKLATTSIVDSQFGRLGLSMPGPDMTIVQAAWDQPYGAIPHRRTTGYKAPMMLPVSSLRSVGASQNAFFHESAINELAAKLRADPVQLRLDLITDEPSRKVVEAVAARAGWDRPPPTGRARGVAFCLSFGVPVAEIVEISETPRGIKVEKVWAAVDVGTALDPASVVAQVQSAVIYGLSAAISGEITVADGKVQQSNFHDYEPLRLYQCPEIDVVILENNPKLRGIGEPGLPPVAPALAEALFQLRGERVRALPLKRAAKFI